MAIGSILAQFSELELSTADDRRFRMKNGFISRLALRIIGLPHLGFRRRAKVILEGVYREIGAARMAGKGVRILDAGCGYGLYSLTLASEDVATMHAIDIDAERVQALGALVSEQPHLAAHIKLHTGSLTRLPFADASYDIAICSEVIEHIADHESAIRELARILKPGGTLLLSVPHDSAYNRKTYRRFDHQRPGYTKETLTKMLAPHGIAIAKDVYYEFGPGIVLFNIFNALNSKALMGILFYPIYGLYRLDALLGIGEPSYIIIRAVKAAK